MGSMVTSSENKPESTHEPVTLLEVARLARVSASTVSRILNGTAKVAPGKREAVEQAIAQLNFKPNLFARSLKTGITMTVGVLTQSIESQYYSRALKGIEVGLQESGHSPIIVSGHWQADTDLASLKVLISRRVDGLIILTGCIDDAAVLDVARNQPVVITERALQGPNVCSIKLDQRRGGYLATKHLLSLGHTRIAHIAGVQHRPDAEERYQGYLAGTSGGRLDRRCRFGGARRLYRPRAVAGRCSSWWPQAPNSRRCFVATTSRPWAHGWPCLKKAFGCRKTFHWWVLMTCRFRPT